MENRRDESPQRNAKASSAAARRVDAPRALAPLLSANDVAEFEFVLEDWAAAIARIESRLQPRLFRSWFGPLEFLGCDDGNVRVGAPGQFHRDWIRDNYSDVLIAAFAEVTGAQFGLVFELVEPRPVAAPEPTSPEPVVEAAPTPAAQGAGSGVRLQLRDDFTFDEFVVGTNNQFAFAAARAVAEKPGSIYNPLVLFGGVGLGKTHLAQAIANEQRRRDPSFRVCYLSAEQFLNDYVNSTRFYAMDAFRKRYREEVDMLVIDDIQFIAGKGLTQDEFFHTFNALYESRRQIVITCDKFPREIPQLEERLKSRFHWGLIADVQPPELETRMAILKEKAARSQVDLADEVAHFIAAHVATNVRDLEGALTTLLARASLFGQAVTLELARTVIQPMPFGSTARLSFEQVMKHVSEHFRVQPQDLRSEKRHRTVSEPRQVAIWLCRKLLSASYPEIGRQFGGRDHSTIITACRTVEERMRSEVEFRTLVERLERQLNTLS